MEFQAFWTFFQTIIWPLLLGYAAFLHAQLDNLRKAHYTFRAEAQRDYATRNGMTELEQKLMGALNRIDDKVTRILENNRHG